ncbi:MAG: T9SS type A sorting domain-containing protein [candidate division WOR-3 bacterium]|nr:T9SS type A sorting domain-containing protein [candidate division WOR-3 bacterium]
MKGAVLLLLIAGVAFASVAGYHIEPVKASWSGLADPEDGVAQSVVACWDSLERVELFAGAKGSGGAYTAQVLEDGDPVMQSVGYQDFDCRWVKFDQWTDTVAFTKGKTLTIRFTRGGGDSLQYYYSGNDPYKYGSMPNDIAPNFADLCMRVYGRMNAVDSLDFGADECSWYTIPNYGFDPGAFAHRAETANVRTLRLDIDWDSIQRGGWNSWDFQFFDSSMNALDKTAGCQIMGILVQPPEWAETRRGDTWPSSDTGLRWSPPRCLDYSVNHDSNYLAHFIKGLLAHCDNSGFAIHDWEVLNEVNNEDTWPNSASVWRHPNRYYTGSKYVGPDIHSMCGLYVRYASVVDSAIRGYDSSHLHDRIAVNSVNWVNTDQARGFSGKAWLREFYEVTDGITPFWDAISAHPYQETVPWYPDMTMPFKPQLLEAEAETLRGIMREHSDQGELWNTEFSIPAFPWWDTMYRHNGHDTITTEQQDADYCSQTFTTAEGMKALPGGCFDRNYWWLLRRRPGEGSWGLTDSVGKPHAALYACGQTATQLLGKRLNGRVMTGDTRDDSVRVYEFETNDTLHRRTWVCWKNGGQGQGGVNVDLPATVDTLSSDVLAYAPLQQSGTVYANANGWLPQTLDKRPVFISETSAVNRPDLVVDSFRVQPLPLRVGEPSSFEVFVKNNGNKSTPGPVLVNIYWNDSLLTTVTCDTIPKEQGRWGIVLGGYIPQWVHGSGLLKAEANPLQEYVEKVSTDDNCGYIRTSSSRRPDGLIGVVCGSYSNAPLALLRLESHSKEADTTGQTPCDSARLVQWWYGINDTVVHGGDTTAWFYVNQAVLLDTSWLYLSGQGKYKLFLQLKDSWSVSDLIPDTTHPFVVFDTTGPSGSVVVNAGARFAPNANCTLRLAACDSASGVYGMRFSNRTLVNLVRNGTFAATDGSWSFSGGGYDSLLQMAVFSVSPSAESRAGQFVPVESISAHYGDSCVLEASILAHMHGGNAGGDVSFWYWRTRTDTMLHDTVWLSLGSASYSGDVISLTGRYNLSARFLLAPPSTYPGWVWRGGMVKVRAQGLVNGTGHVWTDNVALNLFQPQSGCTWWGAYDTLAAWNMGSTAGQHIIRELLIDSAGAETGVALADTVILDPTAPTVHVSLPQLGQFVSGTTEITGWAYDSIEVASDTWFAARRLFFRHVDSTNWLPVQPDSVSCVPAYPNWNNFLTPAVHLGYWNTELVPNGNYYVMSAGTDSVGHLSSQTTWVVVFNDTTGDDFRAGPPGGGSGMGEGSVYVGSSTGQILHLSDDLDSLDCFQVTDSGSNAYVTAILEVGDDSLLVLDARNKRIHKLHRNGQKGRRLVSGLSLPIDVTRDDNGNFWLVDKGLDRIGKFRRDGTLVFTRGGQGRDSTNLNSPEAIAVKNDLVYVADAGSSRIAVWDTSGNFQGSITGDFSSPTAVMVTDSGAIYLTDGSDGKLKGITPLGGSIVAITASGGSKLRGLVPSENGHSVFALAPQPNMVHKLRIQSDDSVPGGVQSGSKLNLPKLLSLAQPFPNPARTRLSINYALPRQTRVSVRLYDIAGKLVTTLASGDQKPGYYNLTWNRQDAKGRSVACGVYFCTLSAENKRFSRKVVLTE